AGGARAAAGQTLTRASSRPVHFAGRRSSGAAAKRSSQLKNTRASSSCGSDFSRDLSEQAEPVQSRLKSLPQITTQRGWDGVHAATTQSPHRSNHLCEYPCDLQL